MGIGKLLSAFSGGLWYVDPKLLDSYVSIFNSYLLGNLKVPEGKEIKDTVYQEIDNCALITINGTLMNKASYLDAMCGMTSYAELNKLIDNCNMENIGFLIDSPGGMEIGCRELAYKIYSLRESKFTFALNTGQMASAAYYLGSACDVVYSSGSANSTGCIGAVCCHMDQSSLDAKEGIKYTYISSGKLKHAGNPHEALDSELLSKLQKDINEGADTFMSDIIKFRGLKEESVIELKKGASYRSNDALSLGLIDGIKTLTEILKEG